MSNNASSAVPGGRPPAGVAMSGSAMSGVTHRGVPTGARSAAGSGGEPPPVEGFERLEELGRGATTVVYRVRRAGTEGPDYAMKLLRERPADPDKAASAFRREAALLACAASPGLATVHEVGEAAGHPYLVMELVEGRSLAQLLVEHNRLGTPLQEQQIVVIATDAANALAAAHRSRLVHRDVKPQNLIITPEGRTRLIDLGLATWANDGTDAGDQVAGTFRYSAPEQTGMLARGVDARSDLYALGVVLFECATGRPPFDAEDVGELLHLHAASPPPDLGELRPDMSARLVRIVAKLLAKDPDDRYQTAAGLAADLRPANDTPAEGQARRDAGGPWAEAAHERPLVGRDREVARLIARRQRAQAGQGGVALIRGPAGSGRGRLARELAVDARRDGMLVLTASCGPDDLVPAAAYGAAIDEHLAAVQDAADVERQQAFDRIRQAGGSIAALLGGLSPALRRLLGGADPVAGEWHDQFATAVADFLLELARLSGGALLVIEDIGWLDPLGRSVLQHLAAGIDGAPLLVLGTLEVDGQAAQDVTDGLVAELGRALDVQLWLDSLTEGGVAELVASQLGGGSVPVELSRQLMIRSGGNPLAVVEYVRAMVEAGALRPSWGTWVLHADVLDDLRLPSDVMDLMVSRLDLLDDPARRCLVTAAVQGRRFSVEVVAAAHQVAADEVAGVVAAATRAQVVEPVGNGRHAFVHEHIRTAVLAGVATPDLAELHHRIAEALASSGTGEDELVYELARHRAAAGRERAPREVHAACLAAARLLLRRYTPVEAVAYFEEALAAARLAGIDFGSQARRDHATALVRAGALDAAQAALESALDHESNRLERARLHELMARVHLTAYDSTSVLEVAGRGLVELGRLWPQRRVLHMLVAATRVVTGLVVGLWPRHAASGRGRSGERYVVEAALLMVASDAASLGADERLMAAFLGRALHAANRLGPSPERIKVLARFGLVASAGGAVRNAKRRFARARREAALLADPILGADVEQQRATSIAVSTGRPEAVIACAQKHGRWLPLGDQIRLLVLAAGLRQAQGYAREATQLADRARILAGDDAATLAYLPRLCMASARSLLGDAEAVALDLEALEDRAHDPHGPPEHRLQHAWSGLFTALDRGDGQSHVEKAIAELTAARIPTGTVLAAWIASNIAFGRLAQAQALADGPLDGEVTRAERLMQAGQALRVVRSGGRRLGLRTTWLLGRAWAAHLRGDRAAWRRLARVDRAVERTDSPLLVFEAARLRARLLRAAGYRAGTAQHAQIALALAVEHGWIQREQWIRDEFDLRISATTPAGTAGTALPGTSVGGTETRLRRRLDALQTVSAAAASVVDPKALTRVVLDVTLKIVAAERAFLFLVEREGGDNEVLTPHQGRTATGEDLHELTDFSATLVQRVCASREALVVTGTSEGAALGSESAVLHGLRSILIAPLLLKGRLMGVLYLDSRVTKGVFAPDDGELLTAIGNHVAASLETARAAQLEGAVRAARQQRDLAERLRESMKELSGTLEPDQVLRRLLATVVSVLPGDRACLLRLDDGQLVAQAGGTGTADDDPAVAPLAALVVGDHPVLEHVLAAGGPVVGGDDRTLPPPLPDELAAALGNPRSWLAVPLSARDERIGAILVGSGQPGAYGKADTDIAAALAGQATVAYDNAQLFSRVQQLATTDVLTGLNNRDHFWRLAEQLIANSTRHQRELGAIMLDIDHFKEVNDTYGHAVGDSVLREVADRLRSPIRTGDLLGRYGGEEFALLLPDTGAAAVLAERLRANVSASPVSTDAGPVRVTISLGVAELRPGDDLDGLLARADTALYRSKRTGRDRVTLA